MDDCPLAFRPSALSCEADFVFPSGAQILVLADANFANPLPVVAFLDIVPILPGPGISISNPLRPREPGEMAPKRFFILSLFGSGIWRGGLRTSRWREWRESCRRRWRRPKTSIIVNSSDGLLKSMWKLEAELRAEQRLKGGGGQGN
ncbi:Uncharacterized protein HZ326_30475 [Fusarium oxysporum f. sp. albedinis]|nr:Uncharacterized protein HZ326_30475 [Fusarium oxysporum f. sp. albedinis]